MCDSFISYGMILNVRRILADNSKENEKTEQVICRISLSVASLLVSQAP